MIFSNKKHVNHTQYILERIQKENFKNSIFIKKLIYENNFK